MNPVSARIFVNGKFLAQPMTGTQRYAYELTKRIADRHAGRIELVVPSDARVPESLAAIVNLRRTRLRGQLFEQVGLPWFGRHGVVVSLGGPAPAGCRRQVVTLHDVSAYRFPTTYSRSFGAWYRTLYRVLARRAEAVVTVSEFSRREINAVLGRALTAMDVVPNGADHTDGITPQRPSIPDLSELLAGGRPWALCVGTLAKHKNLAPTLDAFERAGIAAVVVGARGSGKVFASVDPARWPGALMAGRLEDSELAWLYQHATALVFPSLYEGFGLPIVEAQRQGCPVVAVRTASIPEVAGDGAILCDVGRPDDLADAVRRIDADPRLRSQLIAQGVANASRFEWDRSADLLDVVLERVAGP